MSRHDRYLIYKMLGREVSFDFRIRRRVRKLKGVVERVCRNVFESRVEITVNGHLHQFAEPSAIVMDGKDQLVFVYGDLDERDLGDAALFAEYREAGHSGETLDDVIKRTSPVVKESMRFEIGERVIKPTRTFRKRNHQAVMV
jgi:hypothetical protein